MNLNFLHHFCSEDGVVWVSEHPHVADKILVGIDAEPVRAFADLAEMAAENRVLGHELAAAKTPWLVYVKSIGVPLEIEEWEEGPPPKPIQFAKSAVPSNDDCQNVGRELTERLREVGAAIKDDHPEWAKQIEVGLRANPLTDLSGSPEVVDAKLAEISGAVRPVRDTITDVMLPDRLSQELHELSGMHEAMKRWSWRAMGRPSFDANAFPRLFPGSPVSVLAGKAVWYDHDGTPNLAPDVSWCESFLDDEEPPSLNDVLEAEWEVYAHWGYDPSNAPIYFVVDGPDCRTAQIRAEALAVRRG